MSPLIVKEGIVDLMFHISLPFQSADFLNVLHMCIPETSSSFRERGSVVK